MDLRSSADLDHAPIAAVDGWSAAVLPLLTGQVSGRAGPLRSGSRPPARSVGRNLSRADRSVPVHRAQADKITDPTIVEQLRRT